MICEHKSMQVMDYGPADSRVTNRICLNCGQHWFGESGELKEYTRKEWDARMNDVPDLEHA